MKLTILGSIGSGKSTVAKYIAEKHGITLFEEKFLENPFLTDFYEAIGRGESGKEYIFQLQMYFLNQYQRQSLEMKSYKEYIQDAGGIAGICFVTTQISLSQMSKDVGELYFNLWKQSFLEMDLIDREGKYIIIDREVDDLMSMISIRGRDYEADMPREYIEELKNAYLNVEKILRPYGIDIQVVHIKAGTSVEDVAKLIMERVR